MAIDPRGIVTETSKQVGSFFGIMKEQPLSLALVVMNVFLIAFLFYYGMTVADQRKATTAMVVKWQQATDTLMANCVSSEIMQMVLNALERANKSTVPPSPPPPESK